MNRPFIDFAVLSQGADNARLVKAGETIFKVGTAATNSTSSVRERSPYSSATAPSPCWGEGEVFGEMALIDAGPRSASAVAEGDCEIVP